MSGPPRIVRAAAPRPPSIVRVPNPSAPRIVRTIVSAAPSVVRRDVPGIPGETGPQGETGPAGITRGFGQITYTERAVRDDDVFAAGERKQLHFDPAATVTQDFLRSPFAGLSLFQNDRLVGRAFGDMTIGVVNLIVVAMQAGGIVKLDVDVGSTFGPTGAGAQPLLAGANIPERVSFPFHIQTLGNVLANGAGFFLTTNRPLTVTSESVLICPISLGPDA